MEVLREFAARAAGGQAARASGCGSPSRRWRSRATAASRSVEIVRNRLVADERGASAPSRPSEHESIAAGLVFRSVGYHGVALDGVPFDERRGTMTNEDGRVLGGTARRCPASTAPAGSSAARQA